VIAPALPAELAPAAPFPAILAQSGERSALAPGIDGVRYRLTTSVGPLVVHVVAIDPHEPTVRLGSVLARDALVSRGETVSAMAHRTGAVAGINADFFDIGATNQPVGMLVRDGALVRSPATRAVLEIGTDRGVRIGPVAFSGAVTTEAPAPAAVWPLTGVDVWPPEGGVSLIAPAFGTLVPARDVAFATLSATETPGRYRVGRVLSADAARPAELGLAFGPTAQAVSTPPQPGTTLRVAYALDPPLATTATAVGGGPQLVRDGAPYADPATPAPEDAGRRMPIVGALRTADGRLVLVEADGRAPGISVGLTRAEFAQLLIALSAVDAMQFDSGGSAELVARVPGMTEAQVASRPSDGTERPVADALFAYSDAPTGPPAALAPLPGSLALLTGAHAPIAAAVVDRAGHALAGGETAAAGAPLLARSDPPGLATLDPAGIVRAGPRAGTGVLHLARGTLRGDLPVRVLADLAQARIAPANADPGPGERLRFTAVGLDASGAPVGTDGVVRWSTDRGTIAPDGGYVAGAADATIAARIGGRTVATVVRVGRRDLEVPWPGSGSPGAWSFATVPAGGAGSLDARSDELRLTYDFGNVRAAYARTRAPLPGMPRALSLDVTGDGSGVGLRAEFANELGERIRVTLASAVAWTGTRRVRAALPSTASGPLVLTAIYAIDGLAGMPTHGSGTIGLRNLRLEVAGTSADGGRP